MSFIINIHVDQVVSRYIPASLVENGPNVTLVRVRPLRIRHQDTRQESPLRRPKTKKNILKNISIDGDNNVTYTLVSASTGDQLPIRLVTKQAAASEVSACAKFYAKHVFFY